jgi:NAD(P)H dehydrogenase (quinone)
MAHDPGILVTGAGGKFGRQVCAALLAAGHPRVIAASRQPERLRDLALAGVEVRHADFDQPATLDASFAGICRALIVSTDALAVPGARRRQHGAALEAALRQGVRHVVYTSMSDPVHSTAIPFAADHAAMEEGLRRSGAEWSSLRNSWYQENLLAYLPQIVRDGTWFTAAGKGRIAFVARTDAAVAAATVLATGGPQGAIDIAGPQSLTIDEMAVLVGATLGRRIRVEHVGPAIAHIEMARQGIDPGVIGMVAMTEANQKGGHFDLGAQALTALLGRPPRTLEEFVRTHQRDLLALAG